MKITTKINLLTTAWMLIVLIIINAVVLFLFMKTTVNMEKDTMEQKAADIIQDLNQNETPEKINEQLKDYLSNYSYIRIIYPGNKIIYQASNDKALTKKVKGKYSTVNVTERKLFILNNGEKQVLIIRVPIKEGNQVTGTVEIGERLLGLEGRKDTLLWILGVCTIIATILSLLGGIWLSNVIMRPISSMIKTMEDIEQSGVPQKIHLQNKTKDELQTLARTFNRMMGRLEENMEKQTQFLSDASHELKTPLTVIKSYANLLRRHGVGNTEMADEAIQAIHSEASRIQKMTETFLDLAALGKDSVLELHQVNLVSLCQSTLKQLKAVYKREITLHFSQSPIYIMADELKMKQVMIILLDNAIKYSSDKIEVFLEKNEANVFIHVKDYGIGIPSDEIDNIFERFYRVDKARSRETGGSGLGLHIAKSIIKLHQGDIKINSKEGIGTEVELVLPVKTR
jgi:two-component system sensor histidine kinase ArlS